MSGGRGLERVDGQTRIATAVEHYLFIQELFIEAPIYFAQGAPGRHRFFRDFVTGKGTLDQINGRGINSSRFLPWLSRAP